MQSSTPDDILLSAGGGISPSTPPVLPGGPAAAFRTLAAESLSEGIRGEAPPVDIRHAFRSCGFVRTALQKGGHDYTQPMWNLTTLLATFCHGGEQLAHLMGNQHPGYTPGSTQALWERKLRERKANNLGWPSCQAIRDAGCTDCASCPLWGKIRSPLAIAPPAEAPRNPEAAAQATSGLSLPGGYALNGHGFVCKMVMPKSDGSDDGEDAGLIPVQLFYSKLSDPWAQSDAINFTTTLDAGSSRRVCVPLSDFGVQKICDTLLKRGVKFVPENKKYLEGFFMAWLSKLHASPARASTQFGWYQERIGAPVTGFAVGGTVFLKDGKTLPVNFSDPVLQSYYTASGTIEHWFQAAKELIWKQNRPELEAIVAMAFAAPLVRFDGKDSCVLSVWSASGSNKTTALDIGLAVWGHPKFTKETQSSTEKSVRQRMGATRNLPLMWDEITTPQQMAGVRRLLMDASLGIEGGRLHVDASQKTRGEWTTTMTFCANKSIVDSIATHDKGNDALAVRVFEYQASVPPENAPGRLPDYIASRLIGALRDNYGHVGLRYARLLAASVDKLDAMLRATHASLDREFQFRGSERFWRSTIATCLVGATLANQIGCEFHVDALRKFFKQTLLANRMRIYEDVTVQGTHDHVSQILSKFLAQSVDRTLWTDRSSYRSGVGGRRFDGFINVVYAPRDVTARVRAPSVHFVQDGYLMIARQDLVDWMNRVYQDPPISAFMKGLVQYYGATRDRLTFAAHTPYARPNTYTLIMPIDDKHELWPLLQVPPPPEPSP